MPIKVVKNVHPTIIRHMEGKVVKQRMEEIPEIKVQDDLLTKILDVKDLPSWIDAHNMKVQLTGEQDRI